MAFLAWNASIQRGIRNSTGLAGCWIIEIVKYAKKVLSAYLLHHQWLVTNFIKMI